MDARIVIRGPDGRTARLGVEVKRGLTPRGLEQVALGLKALASEEPLLVIAPYLSGAVRERLAEQGVSYLDLTGNVSLVTVAPAIFIETQGADVDPNPPARGRRSLRGSKAGRIVRTLIDHRVPAGVRELAEITGVNPGYVSRIAAVLDREALIERRGRGRIVSVDWPRLLERWAEDAPLASRGAQTMCLAPRGITSLTSRLSKSELDYALTGTLAAVPHAAVAEARLAVLYVSAPEEALAELDLRPTERGANVMLIEPEDEWVFTGTASYDGLRVVAPSQAAADLLTSPGRGPSEGRALIQWMRANEELWRE